MSTGGKIIQMAKYRVVFARKAFVYEDTVFS